MSSENQKQGKEWRGATGAKFPGGTVCDFFPLPRVCNGCTDGAMMQGNLSSNNVPTHVHEAGNTYDLVILTPSTQKDAAGVLNTVADGGATVASATQKLGLSPHCDHGNFGFPKSFYDPVKERRLQYGWVQGGGFGGEEDGAWCVALLAWCMVVRGVCICSLSVSPF